MILAQALPDRRRHTAGQGVGQDIRHGGRVAPVGCAQARVSTQSDSRIQVELLLQMAKNEQECWARVKDRLRSSVGDDVYNSWFARVDLEQLNSEAVHMS